MITSTSSEFTIIGRLLPDGSWDNSFKMLQCELPLLNGPSPFWFSPPSWNPRWLGGTTNGPPAPTAAIVQQPDGVFVIGGAFETVNGELRRRLARVNPDGALRGRLLLHLTGANSDLMRLHLPAEVETPYQIQTSTDLIHWFPWLNDDYPWWPAELWLNPNEPVRYFRALPTQ